MLLAHTDVFKLPHSCACSAPPGVWKATNTDAALLIQDSKTLEAGVTWLEQDLYQGGIVFVAVMAVAHVLLVPGAVFCLAAGAIFGVLAGSALAWLGTTVGQTLAFCMGR